MKARIGQLLLAATVALGIGGNAHAGWVDVYSNDFNSGPSAAISGAGALESVAGYNGVGTVGNQFSGQYLVNTTGCVSHCTPLSAPVATTLTLSSLAPHTAIRVSFLLAIRDSWDGTMYAPNPGLDISSPDYFNVTIDGNAYFSETFSHRLAFPLYTFTYVAPAGGLLTPTSINRGGNSSYPDHAYDMGLDTRFQSIAHNGDTLTLSFFANGAGWQGGADESFGIDNLRISVLADDGTVPEPGTLWMTLLGALAIYGVKRQRRAA